MNIAYRKGTYDDIPSLKDLALRSWSQFQPDLTPKNWQTLLDSLTNDATYSDLLEIAHCFVCTLNGQDIVGMVFFVPNGHPTDIYKSDWCYIRFLTVDPKVGGHGIGRKLTDLCIETAIENNEVVIALHTSELMYKARCIYESLGFTVLKEIDQRLGMRYWLYMRKLIESENKPLDTLRIKS